MNALTLEEARIQCPSVFAKGPDNQVSNKYSIEGEDK